MKRKWMMTVLAVTMTAAMMTACGNSGASTEEQTENAAKTEVQTETQEEIQEETIPETMAETEPESETAAPAETEEVKAEPKTMYVVSDVYIRQEPDASSEAVAVAYLGDEVTAEDVDEKWCKVTLGDKEGYVVKEYLTESKDEADQAVKSEEAAKEAAEAQAAAAAQAAQQSQSSGGGGKYEVSRQAYPDCDGSGHGYYEITYSDGSVETVEY